MAVQILKEKNRASVQEVILGATPDMGGTRSHVVKIGGDSCLPFLQFEGETPNSPVVSMEIQDIVPNWPETLTKHFEGVLDKPAEWAKKCVEEYGADLVHLKFAGADPDGANRSNDECVQTLKEVLQAVKVPLIIEGSGSAERDNSLMEAIAEAGAGENLVLASAEQDNYKTITAACMVHKHVVIAKSPLDINICKQLNILISEMNLPLNRIIIDPSIGALGYGIEYAYSILERSRLGALQGDKMLSMPVCATVGYEAWRSKEAAVSEAEQPGWGDAEERGILWETVTATALLQSGVHLLMMRHPKSVELAKKAIQDLMVPNKYD